MRLRFALTQAVSSLALLFTLALLAGTASAQQAQRVARVGGHPNINGVWQAMNTANWNLEGQSAEATEFWQLGALFAIPAGPSVVEGGTIPYLPAALEQRERNKANWPAADPETKCFRAGIPRSTYLPYPFRIVQGDGDIMFIYEFATSNRTVRMKNHLSPDEVLVEQWLGWSNGRWEGDTLVIDVFGLIPRHLARSLGQLSSGHDRHRKIHAARREPPLVRGDDHGSEDVLAPLEDFHALVSKNGAQRGDLRVQVRRVRRAVTLWRASERTDNKLAPIGRAITTMVRK